MSDSLTLPGSIPGLLRRGSPCILASGQDSPAYWLDGRAVTLHALADDMASAACDGLETVVHVAHAALLLDLSDATGRAHAAWWLATWLCDTLGRIAQRPDTCSTPRLCWRMPHRLRAERNKYRSLYLLGFRGFADQQPPRSEAVDPRCVIPGLADLDPRDRTPLLDGSRWVDAEALRRVVLHVAGLED